MAKTTKSAGNAGAAGAADATQLAQILGSLETQETPPHPQDTAEDPPIGGSSPSQGGTGAHTHPTGAAAGNAGSVTPRIRYESRIAIVEAWQYPGNVVDAPPFIDRNWIGFADEDPVRGIEAGPCLRVPRTAHDPSTGNIEEVVLCRIGDYVARQSVDPADGTLPILKIEVWAQEQFEKLFVPRTAPLITGHAGVAASNAGGQAAPAQEPATSSHPATPGLRASFPVADESSWR